MGADGYERWSVSKVTKKGKKRPEVIVEYDGWVTSEDERAWLGGVE